MSTTTETGKYAVELTEAQRTAIEELRILAILSQNTVDLMTFKNKHNGTPESIDDQISLSVRTIKSCLRGIPSQFNP